VFRFLFGRGRSTSTAARDDDPMKVIVGLGNPGKEYERTRHNVGWWVVDHLADVWRFDSWRKDGEARVATGSVGSAKVRLIKPLTYMNLSGAVLRPYMRRPFWSAATDLMVVVDEVALPLGRYRFRAKGSAGGHNGLKSIEGTVQSQEYPRLRIGIAPEISEILHQDEGWALLLLFERRIRGHVQQHTGARFTGGVELGNQRIFFCL
jgi:PTH1 family peptidyl-tRNA hydrolase